MWGGGTGAVVGGDLYSHQREGKGRISFLNRLFFLLKKQRGWKGFSNVLYPKNPPGILLKSRY